MEPDLGLGRLRGVESRAIPARAAVPQDLVAGSSIPFAAEADEEARFCAFYRSTREPVARALAVTLGEAELAAEATDEAMARAFQRWASVGALANPGGWVYRVGFNWACSRLRSRRRARAVPWPAPVDVPGIPPIGEPAVARALAELDVRQRAVVVCRYLLGWSEAETAAALHTPIGTVKSRLHRASRQLAERLSHLRPEEGS